MNFIEEEFGCDVLTNDKLKTLLKDDVYKKFMKIVINGDELELEIANEIANAMMKWAIEKGATHYAHWFQPLTGKTAAKYDAFLDFDKTGKVITKLSGKELIKGESDASSFPSGGLRSTFEARGYTFWDVTSPVFVKENALYIPTIFYSFTDEVLDKKTPLLRSEDVLSKYAIEILKMLDNKTSNRVISNVGAEQEYFLIDRNIYEKRKDIKFTGRTLIGKKPAKAQEDDDHYFGYLRTRVASYMNELDEELWKLGIPVKTKHNEAAPSQHEIVPIYTEVNVACDNNQLMMEVMRKVAKKHNLVCLLHEKPFYGIAGSGKHNNWSLTTDDGINLFDPGKDIENNIIFLIFTAALIKAVDEHSDLLRISTITPGNDLRLGVLEAPPCIISMFLGTNVENALYKFADLKEFIIEDKINDKMNIGIKGCQNFKRDTQDRNRTSPFAFTGNKFEFRMLPSSINLYTANTILHTIMIDSLSFFVERLKNATNVKEEAKKLIKEVMVDHKRIIFNGDNYSKEWEDDAKKRGLLNAKDSSEALGKFKEDKNVELFSKFGILSKDELMSQISVIDEEYTSQIKLESKVLYEMIENEILPSVYSYIKELADINTSCKSFSKSLRLVEINDKIIKLTNLSNDLYSKNLSLCEMIADKKQMDKMSYCSKEVTDMMNQIRTISDSIEGMIPKDKWPIPTYEDILYGV